MTSNASQLEKILRRDPSHGHGLRSSEWERAISVIESVLDPNGDAAAALTEEQETGMKELRNMLLNAGTHYPYVPKTILENTDDSVNSYIASEFGGVRGSEMKLKNAVKKVMNARSFMKKMLSASTKKMMEDSDALHYVPSEWKELSFENRKRVGKMLSWKSLSSWSFNALALSEACEGEPLLFMGWAILGAPHAQAAMAATGGGREVATTADDFDGYDYVKEFNMNPEKLCAFLRAVEADYRADNPYHNNVHAADVLQTTNALLQLGARDFSVGEIDSLALLLAAAVHDIGHPGKNNSFQINAQTDLALVYNDNAVLENMHAARAFRMLLGAGRKPDLDILEGLQDSQRAALRTRMIEAILATDMKHHFAMVSQLKGTISSYEGTDPKVFLSKDGGKAASDVLKFILHVADISNPAKPAPMFEFWADRCLEEFFAQGDMEKRTGLPVSPMCDRTETKRAESQIGFIKFIVRPSFELVGELVPRVASEVLPIIEANISYWEKLKVEEGAAP